MSIACGQCTLVSENWRKRKLGRFFQQIQQHSTGVRHEQVADHGAALVDLPLKLRPVFVPSLTDEPVEIDQQRAGFIEQERQGH